MFKLLFKESKIKYFFYLNFILKKYNLRNNIKFNKLQKYQKTNN